MPASMKDLPLDQLLIHLGERRATGTLTVDVPHARKKLYLLDGLLAGVTSTNPRELLGHFLVGWGLVSEEQVAEGMRLQEQLGTPLGRILERMGAIDSESLGQALVAQCEEAVLDLFIAARVETLYFAENILPIDRPLELRRPLAPLVLEGLRRRDTQRELHHLLSGRPVILQRLEGSIPDSLSPRDRLILAAVDGQRSLEDVAFMCHLSPFFVAELAARGVQEKFLRVRPADEPPVEASVHAVVQAAHTALAEGDLLAAWRAVQLLRGPLSGYHPPPETTAILSAITERVNHLRASASMIPHISDPSGASTVLPGGSTEMAFVFSRINGAFSLRQIQRITPLEELHFWVLVETLMRTGTIELQPPLKGVLPVSG